MVFFANDGQIYTFEQEMEFFGQKYQGIFYFVLVFYSAATEPFLSNRRKWLKILNNIGIC
jgi:hypothetical protein